MSPSCSWAHKVVQMLPGVSLHMCIWHTQPAGSLVQWELMCLSVFVG